MSTKLRRMQKRRRWRWQTSSPSASISFAEEFENFKNSINYFWNTVLLPTLRQIGNVIDTLTTPDEMVVQYEGLPGLAEKCWADVWTGDDYRSCNADPDAESSVGLCPEHSKQLASID